MKGVHMKYTLAQNAISSLSIAIEKFKIVYYNNDKYAQSEIDEAIKICIVFLENSIELMLKKILASSDPLSIYADPNSRDIQNALSEVNDSCRLEDILISKNNFRTITYTQSVQKYNENYHNSDKLYCVLTDLGAKRNAITHFGLDGTEALDELIVCLINAFDIIYNYLYPQLIEFEDIGFYFTSDDLVVDTIHGKKLLFNFDDDQLYNNIIDFLDELMETSKDAVCALRASKLESKIYEFTGLLKELIKDSKYCLLLEQNHARIDFGSSNFEENYICFDVYKNSDIWDSIGSCYSPYYNVTAFCGEGGEIYFLIVHDKHELYIYNQRQFIIWPQCDEAEPDNQWLSDYANGACEKFKLSKRNLLRAFESVLKD